MMKKGDLFWDAGDDICLYLGEGFSDEATKETFLCLTGHENRDGVGKQYHKAFEIVPIGVNLYDIVADIERY